MFIFHYPDSCLPSPPLFTGGCLITIPRPPPCCCRRPELKKTLPIYKDEQRLADYRSQVEEYELRLKRSFDEKERACAELTERIRRQQEQTLQQREQRRSRSAEQGHWLGILQPGCQAWSGEFLSEMAGLHARQSEAEVRLERCNAFVEILLDTLEEALAQLEQHGEDSQKAAAVDLSRTIDLRSTEGGHVLRRLGRGPQGQLQNCRHLLLRWQSLQKQLQQSDSLRRAPSLPSRGCRSMCSLSRTLPPSLSLSMYMYMYIYIEREREGEIHLSLSLSLSLHIYIYIYAYSFLFLRVGGETSTCVMLTSGGTSCLTLLV